MDDDFEYLRHLLRHLRKFGDASQEEEEFFIQLQAYQDAGWPFGREKGAFLMWVEFGQGTTTN